MRCHKFRIPCLTKYSRGWRTVICSDSESSERWKKGRRSNHGLFWGAKWTCCIVCIVAKYLWSKGNPPCADVLQPVFNCVLDSFALTLPKHPKQTGDAGRLFIGFYWWLSSSLCIWDKLGFQLRSCLTWQLVASKQCKLSAPSAQQIQQHESLGNWWKLMERQYGMSMNVAYQEDSRGIPGIHLVLSLCFAAILHHCLAFRALSPVALHPNLFRVCLQSSLIWFAIWRATVPIYSKHLKTTQSQDLPAGCNKQFARNKHWQLPPKPENSIQDTNSHNWKQKRPHWPQRIHKPIKPAFNIFQFVPQIHHSSSWFLWRPVIPRYSKRIQKIQKDSKHFEAFRVAFEPSLIPKSFFGWRNLHLPHLWTQDETWIVRKSAQPPSQRLWAKANKRRRKGPVTTFQANTPNHAVSNFQTVERQLIKIVEKGGQRSTGSKWSITETHRSASSAWQSNWVSMREASFRALHCSSRIMSSYFDSSM